MLAFAFLRLISLRRSLEMAMSRGPGLLILVAGIPGRHAPPHSLPSGWRLIWTGELVRSGEITRALPAMAVQPSHPAPAPASLASHGPVSFASQSPASLASHGPVCFDPSPDDRSGHGPGCRPASVGVVRRKPGHDWPGSPLTAVASGGTGNRAMTGQARRRR